MNLKSMLLALSLIGSTSFLVANEDEKQEDTVVVAEPTEVTPADEQPSCGCGN